MTHFVCVRFDNMLSDFKAFKLLLNESYFSENTLDAQGNVVLAAG